MTLEQALALIPAGSQYDLLRFAIQRVYRSFESRTGGFSASRIQGWIDEISSGSGRSAGQIRNDIFEFMVGVDLIMQNFAVTASVARQLISGEVTFRSLPQPTEEPEPEPPPPPPPPPEEEPPPPEEEPADEIDYRARVAALYPWLPDELVQVFADAWAESGDQALALAQMRAHSSYDSYFPGIKREDGSLRMSEQEWFSTREAYARLFTEFGLNSDLFSSRFTELMEGSVSAAELAARLGAAYDQIITNIPQVREAFARFGGIDLTDAAIFAAFIDPDIGQAILNRQISVALVGGEAFARGFDINQGFAERLTFGGVDQFAARSFFADAEGRLPTLDELARRFRDPDSTFDVEELAEASIFGSAGQSRRLRRLLAAESSLFTEQTGKVATGSDLAVTGLSAR